MKSRKIVSMFLTLTLVISVFAALPFNVSAHQNFSGSINFEGATPYTFPETPTTSTTPVRPSGTNIRISHGTNSYKGITIEEAPKGDYGDSCKVFALGDWGDDALEVGAASQYVEVQTDGMTAVSNSIYFESSFYFVETTKRAYRSIRFKGGSTRTPILFTDGGGISIFGVSAGLTWDYGKWYDLKLWYNMNTGYFEAEIYVDGEKQYSGSAQTAQTATYINTIEFFYNNSLNQIQGRHKAGATSMGDQVTYWDNVKMKSIDKVEPVVENKIIDFTGFEGQQSGSRTAGMPTSSLGTWQCGYRSANPLTAYSYTDDAEHGTSLRFVGTPYDLDANPLDYNYMYPRIYFTPSRTPSGAYQISFSIKVLERHGLIGLKGSSNNTYMLSFYDTASIMGNSLGVLESGGTGTWYDVDIKYDQVTGYYDASFINEEYPDDPEKSFNFKGYDSRWLGSTEYYFMIDKSSKVNCRQESSVLIDNFYIGKCPDLEVPSVTYADTNLTASESATVNIPYSSAGIGYEFESTLTVTGSAPSVSIGGTAIDTSALTAGAHSLKISARNTPSVNVTIDDAAIAETISTVPTSITLTAGSAEGDAVSLTDVSNTIVYDFAVSSEESLKDVALDDDITIEFTNALADSVTSSAFTTVYAPTGVINNAAKIDGATAVISGDRKSVTISFDKDYATHYHIPFTVTDTLGTTLTDYVELDTVIEPYITPLKIYNSAGTEINTANHGDTVIAKFSSAGKTGNVIFAIAAFADNSLVDINLRKIDLSNADSVERIAIIVPSDTTKTYRVKAFCWTNATLKPYENALTVPYVNIAATE